MAKSSFGFKQPEDSPGFLLWQTTISWQRLIKNALEEYGISHAQFVILATLLWLNETKQTPIQSIIVNMTKLDKMTVSKALKSLADKSLVKRNEHNYDTRAKQVCLTPQGKKLTKTLITIVEKIDHDFFGILNKKQQQSLITCLNDLIN